MDEVDPLPQPPLKKRRRRIVAAHTCVRCTKRKTKCNKQIPCEPCIAQGCADTCELYVPLIHDRKWDGSPVESRSTNRVTVSKPVTKAPSVTRQSISSVNDSPREIPALPSISVDPVKDGAPKPPSQRRPTVVSETPVAILTASPVHADTQQAILSRLDKLEAIIASNPESWTNREGPTSRPLPEAILRILRCSNLQPSDFSSLILKLPSFGVANGLVDHFFAAINPIRYPIDRSWFSTSFNAVYRTQSAIAFNNGDQPEISVSDLRMTVKGLPLVFIVLASSKMTAPADHLDKDSRKRMNWDASLKLYWSARRAALITAASEPESLEMLNAEFLTFQYLMYIHDRRMSEAWSMLGTTVRLAQSIGCHRDGAKLGLDPIQTEYRRRLWSYILHADHYFSLVLGRPSAILDSHFDSPEPSNFELRLWQEKLPVPRPLDEPTTATFSILRYRFARLTGRIADHFQNLSKRGTYAEVMQLDQELVEFAQNLPPHFRVEQANESMDDVIEGLALSRYMLGTEIMMIRIMLHRPWFLCRLWSDEYALSRQACLWSAKKDFELRTNFRQRRAQEHDTTFTGTFREFNAAIIAGIASIISPHGEDAITMRLIMRTFLDRHPPDQQKSQSKASQKEIAIVPLSSPVPDFSQLLTTSKIYTLYRRAMYVLKNFQWPVQSDGDPIDHILGIRSRGAAHESHQNTVQHLGQGAKDGQQHGHEGDDDDRQYPPDYGEERSTAILIRDIFSTMVKRKMLPEARTAAPSAVASPQLQPVYSGPNAPGNRVFASSAGPGNSTPFPHTTWTGTNASGQAYMPMDPQSGISLDGISDSGSPSLDLQAMFDNWLSANASVNPYPPEPLLPMTMGDGAGSYQSFGPYNGMVDDGYLYSQGGVGSGSLPNRPPDGFGNNGPYESW